MDPADATSPPPIAVIPTQSMEPSLQAEESVLRKRRPLSIKTSLRCGQAREHARKGEEDASAAKEVVEQPLSPAARLFHQPHFNCYIIAILGSAKPIDVGAAQAGLEATLARHPRFSSIQILDESDGKRARWVPTEVNVADHVIVPELDPTASGAVADRVVEDYVASLSTAAAMDPTRPLWEFHILNVPTTEAAAVVVLRIHHSLGDGTSLISLLLACTRRAADPTALPSLPELRRSGPVYLPPPLPYRTSSARSALAVFLYWATALLTLAWNTLVDVVTFVATAGFIKDTPTPFKGSEDVEFRRKRFVHRTISLDDVKLVKTAMHCTVNDVLLGVTSAGLSKYLYRKYDECDDGTKKKKKKKLPKNILVRSTLLVNVRKTPGIQALAEMMEAGNGRSKWGNQLGYMLLPFPIAMHEDPLDYVRKGKAIAERKKKSLEANFIHTCADVIVKLFGVKTASALSHRVLIHTTLSFSNLAGPVEEIVFYGHPVVYLAPSVYGHPHALTVHYQSYMNTMKIVLAVDDVAIPDPHRLLDDFAESLDLIRDAAMANCKTSKEMH